ncbi:MAG TPA: hypothetical protein PKA27_06180 [Fimbriimonadaceae bacterium]|nr:hypothetical protein [Fimbriimonadaceae bacterium]
MDDRKRSRSYPGADLEESIRTAKLIQTSLGPGGHSRDAISQQALGSKGVTGATARKIAAATSFGLLKKSGDGYSVTSLAKSIFRPLPDEEPKLLKDMLFSVTLYRELVEKYQPEGRIPASLPALLERNHGIMHPNGSFAAKIFRDSAIYAGILDSDGNFLSEGPAEPNDGVPYSAEDQGVSFPDLDTRTDGPKRQTDLPPELIEVELPNPGVSLRAPRVMSQKQKERAIEWLDKVAKPWLTFIVEEHEESEADHA